MTDYVVPLNDFRAAREKQKNARRRDRGGIFQPLEKNGLLDVLLQRRKSGRVLRPDKSSSPIRDVDDASDQPRKSRRSSAGVRKDNWVDLTAVAQRVRKATKVKPLTKRRSTVARKNLKFCSGADTPGYAEEGVGDAQQAKKSRRSTKAPQDLSTRRATSKAAVFVLPEKTPVPEPQEEETLSPEPMVIDEPQPDHFSTRKLTTTRKRDRDTKTDSVQEVVLTEPAKSDFPPRSRKRKQEDEDKASEPVLKKSRKPPESLEKDLPLPKARSKRTPRPKATATHVEEKEDAVTDSSVKVSKAKKSKTHGTATLDSADRVNRVEHNSFEAVDAILEKRSKRLMMMKAVKEDEELPAWDRIEPASPDFDFATPIKDGPSATLHTKSKRSKATEEPSEVSPPPKKPRRKKGIEVVVVQSLKPAPRQPRNATGKQTEKVSGPTKENTSRRKAAKELEASSEDDVAVIKFNVKGRPLSDKTNVKAAPRRKRQLGNVPEAVWELAKYGSRRHTIFVRPPSDGEEDELDMLSS